MTCAKCGTPIVKGREVVASGHERTIRVGPDGSVMSMFKHADSADCHAQSAS